MKINIQKHKFSYCTLIVLSSLSLASCGGDDDSSEATPKPEQKALQLNLIHINDHHSHLDQETIKFKADVGLGQEEFSVSRGGFARVTSLMNQLATEKKNVLKMHAGDATTGDLYYNLTDGKADADAMNSVCFDTFTPGNHEFDAQDAGLEKFIGFLDQTACKEKTKILTANVQFGQSSPLYQTKRIQKSHIFEKDGVKFAVIGLTVAKKTKNSSQPNADTLFLDEIASAQKEIDAYKAQGIQKIILQTHVGYDLDQQLAKSLTDVDVIIGGDSHTLLGPSNLSKYGMTPEGTYPTQLKNKDGDLVCIAQAWQYSYIVGELNVKFDNKGKVESCSGTPHVLIGDQFNRMVKDAKSVTESEKQVILNQFIKDQVPFKVVQPDQKMIDILRPYQLQKKSFAEKVVAQAVDNLCSRRVPGTQRDVNRSTLGDACNKNAHVDAHGGDIQQMIAEAFLQQGVKYFNADLSFQNGGGVREDVGIGDVTVGKIYNVLPFKNTLVRLDMTGNEVKATLEDAIDGVIAQNNTGSYPYTGGMRWKVDFTQNKGQRVHTIEIRNQSGEYQPIQLEKLYKVVMIDFLANGGDYYTTLKSIRGERRTDVGLDYAEAFLQYVQALDPYIGTKQIKKLDTKHYSTQDFLDIAK